MRSADIVKNCREVALRVEISGEWGELAETLTQAATEVERLRLRPEEVRFLLGVKTFLTCILSTICSSGWEVGSEQSWCLLDNAGWRFCVARRLGICWIVYGPMDGR